MQSFKDMANVFSHSRGEALAALFHPDTVATAEYFKIYERKAWLGAGEKIMLAMLEDAIGWLQHFVLCNGQPAEERVSESGEMV